MPMPTASSVVRTAAIVTVGCCIRCLRSFRDAGNLGLGPIVGEGQCLFNLKERRFGILRVDPRAVRRKGRVDVTILRNGPCRLVPCAVGDRLDAQWLKEPTRDIPRTADGKPNLKAPAPRTADGKPDLSGLWRFDSGAYGGNVFADLKPEEIRPGADALYKQRMEDLARTIPRRSGACRRGRERCLRAQGWTRIIQTPGLIAILYEDLTFRQIFMDGRALPKDPNPSFMGYSVGRWDGDTLVVDSIGFNETSWLDFGGHPHSEALRTTERLTRKTFGHLDVGRRFDDPKIYHAPVQRRRSTRIS